MADERSNGQGTDGGASGGRTGALPRAQPPLETRPPDIEAVKTVAGGMPAVVSALQHVYGEAGPVRGTQLLLKINQQDGFDCPGCAWPEPDSHRTVTEFCENGAKAVAEEGTSARVTPGFFRQWSVEALSRQSDMWLGKQGRLTHPMVLREGATHYEPLSWEDAFALVAGELNALESPEEACFYTSGRTSNEAAFLYQLFVRQFGTNNLPDCADLCHESSGAALTETIGIGKGTVTLEDFEKAEAIFVIGQNPGTNHPRMLVSLQEAARRGAQIVSINPLPETGLNRFKHPQEPLQLLGGPGTAINRLWLQVRVNGDVALLQGLGKALLEEDARFPGRVLARDFISQRTVGFEAYAAALRALSWDTVVEQSGVPREQLLAAAEILARSEKTIFCWAMGLTQHRNAVANIQEVVNLALLRGSVGKPGAGLCPVRGHSNVQGDRTMGILEKPSAAFLEALEREFGFTAPRKPGLDTVATIRAMHEGRVKVLFALGGNFLSATPDTEFTAEALRRTRLTAHVSTKLNRGHLIHGQRALILPCLGRTERDVQEGGMQFVTVENSMGVVHASRGAVEPAAPTLRSEPDIVASLARATLGARSRVDWAGQVKDYDSIRELISRTVPGFSRFNPRVREPGGFYLPNGPREGRFTTPDGKAHFTVHPLPRIELGAGQLLMMTLRSHDQYNTTVYGMDDRYRGILNGRRVVLMNPEDIRVLGLAEGQSVDLTSHFQGETRVARRFVVVPYRIPRRCAATYFPETNVLVPIDSVAEKSRTPTSKSVVISVAPAQELA
jgi:molybdopterin-dependent oxidoreductase alpha subunit